MLAIERYRPFSSSHVFVQLFESMSARRMVRSTCVGNGRNHLCVPSCCSLAHIRRGREVVQCTLQSPLRCGILEVCAVLGVAISMRLCGTVLAICRGMALLRRIWTMHWKHTAGGNSPSVPRAGQNYDPLCDGTRRCAVSVRSPYCGPSLLDQHPAPIVAASIPSESEDDLRNPAYSLLSLPGLTSAVPSPRQTLTVAGADKLASTWVCEIAWSA